MVTYTDSLDEFMQKLAGAMTSDPGASTREVFTRNLLNIPIPNFAHPEWKKVAKQQQILLEKLANHPAMQPNIQQTYSTPANNKNNVYFIWDFVGRTLGYLYVVDPRLPNGMRTSGWSDVESRVMMAYMLILDTRKGMLDEMTESTYPEQKGKHPAFGDEIMQLVREFDRDEE